jgi:hypothetical protein
MSCPSPECNVLRVFDDIANGGQTLTAGRMPLARQNFLVVLAAVKTPLRIPYRNLRLLMIVFDWF